MNLGSTFKPRFDRLAIILVVVFGVVLRFLVIQQVPGVLESDEIAYHSMAINLLRGEGLVDFMGNRAMYNAGYPLFVLVPLYWLFGSSLLVVQACQALLGGLSIGMVYWVGREAGVGSLGRLLAAAGWALYVPALLLPEAMLKESLMIPLMLGVVGFSLRIQSRGRFSDAMAAGVLFGLLALTANSALTLLLCTALACLLAPAGRVRKCCLAASALCVAALCVTPWLVRNATVVGAPVLNTNGGFNLYLGNNPAATGNFVSIADTPRGLDWPELRKIGEVHASNQLRDDALNWIAQNPGIFIRQVVRKLVLFWAPNSLDPAKSGSSLEWGVRAVAAAQLLVLCLLALGAWSSIGLRRAPIGLLWLAVVAYVAGHLPFYVAPRYRDPIMPFVIVFAASTVEMWWRQRRGDALG